MQRLISYLLCACLVLSVVAGFAPFAVSQSTQAAAADTMQVKALAVDLQGDPAMGAQLPQSTIAFPGGAIGPKSAAVPQFQGFYFRQAYYRSDAGRVLYISRLDKRADGRIKITVRPNKSYPQQKQVELTATLEQIQQNVTFEYLAANDYYVIDYNIADGSGVQIEGEGLIDGRQAITKEGSSAEAVLRITLPRDRELQKQYDTAVVQSFRQLVDNTTRSTTDRTYSLIVNSSTEVTLGSTAKNGSIRIQGSVTSTKAARWSAPPYVARYYSSSNVSNVRTANEGIHYGSTASVYFNFDGGTNSQAGPDGNQLAFSYFMSALDINGVRLAIPTPPTMRQVYSNINDYKTAYAQMRRNVLGSTTVSGGNEVFSGKQIYDQRFETGPLAGSRVQIALSNIRSVADTMTLETANTRYTLKANPSIKELYTYKTRVTVLIEGMYEQEYDVQAEYSATDSSYLKNGGSAGFSGLDGVTGLTVNVQGANPDDSPNGLYSWRNLCAPGAYPEYESEENKCLELRNDYLAEPGTVPLRAAFANGYVPPAAGTPVLETQQNFASTTLTPVEEASDSADTEHRNYSVPFLGYAETAPTNGWKVALGVVQVVRANASPLQLRVSYSAADGSILDGMPEATQVHNLRDNYVLQVGGDVPTLPGAVPFTGYDLQVCTPAGECRTLPDYRGLYPGDTVNLRNLGENFTSPTGEVLLSEIHFVPSTAPRVGRAPLTYIVKESVTVDGKNINRTLVNFQAVAGLRAEVAESFKQSFVGQTRTFSRPGKPDIETMFNEGESVLQAELTTDSFTVLTMRFTPLDSAITVQKKWVLNGVTYAEGEQPTGFNASAKVHGAEVVFGEEYTSLEIPQQQGGGNNTGVETVTRYLHEGDTLQITENQNLSGGKQGHCTLTGTTVSGGEIQGEKALGDGVTVTLTGTDNVYTITNTYSCKQKLKLDYELQNPAAGIIPDPEISLLSGAQGTNPHLKNEAKEVQAGKHKLVANVPQTVQKAAWQCTGGTLLGGAVQGYQLQLEPGSDAECTIQLKTAAVALLNLVPDAASSPPPAPSVSGDTPSSWMFYAHPQGSGAEQATAGAETNTRSVNKKVLDTDNVRYVYPGTRYNFGTQGFGRRFILRYEKYTGQLPEHGSGQITLADDKWVTIANLAEGGASAAPPATVRSLQPALSSFAVSAATVAAETSGVAANGDTTETASDSPGFTASADELQVFRVVTSADTSTQLPLTGGGNPRDYFLLVGCGMVLLGAVGAALRRRIRRS